jgi:GTP-binding protein
MIGVMALLDDAAFLLSETDPARLGESASEAAFVGRSNVGKSSLLNALCRKKLAFTSGTPGRTRLINVFTLGKDRWLVDLPGYGFANAPKAERDAWQAMAGAYLAGRPALRKVFLLIDAEVGPTRLDKEMVDWLNGKRLPWRAVATKADQVKSSRAFARRKEAAQGLGLKTEKLAWVSAKEGLGLAELRAEVASLLELP